MKLEVGSEYKTSDGRIVKINAMNSIGHFYCTHADNDLDQEVWLEDGSVWMCRGDDAKHSFVSPASDAPTGPVRTVTRREVVPGVYLDGTLIVSDAGFGRLQFAVCTTDPESFDKAMDMLRDIRDALEDTQ